MTAIRDPDADGVDEFPGGDRGHVADDGDEVALPARLHLQDGESVVIVMEGHPLDGSDEGFFGGDASKDDLSGRTGTGATGRHFSTGALGVGPSSIAEAPVWISSLPRHNGSRPRPVAAGNSHWPAFWEQS